MKQGQGNETDQMSQSISPRVKNSNAARHSATYLTFFNQIDYLKYYVEGFAYFGVQYGKTCWCGNYEPAYVDGVFRKVDSSQCNMQCTGDASQICGAGNRMSIWTLANYKPCACEKNEVCDRDSKNICVCNDGYSIQDSTGKCMQKG